MIRRLFTRTSAVLMLAGALSTCLPSGDPARFRWFDDQSLYCTILLRKLTPDGLAPLGTGFLLYNYKNPKTAILVTCAHLVNQRSDVWITAAADSSCLRMLGGLRPTFVATEADTWHINGASVTLHRRLVRDSTYVTHENLDVAALPISLPGGIKTDSGMIGPVRALTVPKGAFRYRSECRLGDDVFFNGFPLGIGADTLAVEPVLRSGSIAWCPTYASEFCIDAFSFGGNSGSPVFAKRVGPGDKAMLIGMDFGHFNDIADTLRKNAGLARCLWVDDIYPVAVRAASLTGW